MAKMKSLARHIAFRGTSSKNAMVHIATAAVAISIAVVVISISVILGFKEQISALVSGTIADITISNPYGERQPELHPINDKESLHSLLATTGNIAHSERYALRSCVARGEEGAAGIALKGISTESELTLFSERLEEGTLPQIEEARRKEILLSKSVAEKIGASTNSRVELLLLEDETPRREVFKVCGIYRSALGETGAELALTDIRNVQKINGWQSDTYSGFEIETAEGYDAEAITESLNWNIFENYNGLESISAISAKELYAHIFAWLETHNINATVIIVIMFIVALFNMVTALLILLFERTRMVGILKSLGMNNNTVRQIFLYQAARIVGIGMAVGNVLAAVLILVQKYTGVVKLDATAYYVSEVPVSIGIVDILAINTIFAAAILLLLFVATAIVSRIEPSEAVKYE